MRFLRLSTGTRQREEDERHVTSVVKVQSPRDGATDGSSEAGIVRRQIVRYEAEGIGKQRRFHHCGSLFTNIGGLLSAARGPSMF